MIDAKVFVSLESMQVNFNVTINAKTNEPVTQYEVDEKGMVQEVKSTFEQIEADQIYHKKRCRLVKKKNKYREIIDALSSVV